MIADADEVVREVVVQAFVQQGRVTGEILVRSLAGLLPSLPRFAGSEMTDLASQLRVVVVLEEARVRIEQCVRVHASGDLALRPHHCALHEGLSQVEHARVFI